MIDRSPDPAPARRPGSQPGNRNARTHGAYSATDPAPLADLRQRAHEASRSGHVGLMRRFARLLRERGDREHAYALRAAADLLEAKQRAALGLPPARRRRRVPPAGWRAYQDRLAAAALTVHRPDPN